MIDPTYYFTVPSIHDDTPLDCRIYHPDNIDRMTRAGDAPPKGAIVAHPYAPLGGSYDDETVLGRKTCLVKQGYVVVTFNFRGAGDSAGKVSWSGKPEIDDYATVVGLLVYYLQSLPTETIAREDPTHVELLLAGYSFGSLILARLPAVSNIVRKFEAADRGTSASEVFLRARTLAKQTRQGMWRTTASRERNQERIRDGQPARATTPYLVNMGGEETESSERQRSQDSKRSIEIMAEIPHQINSHIRRHNRSQRSWESTDSTQESAMLVRYLLISPVLVPFTTSLLSPGIPFTSGSDAGLLSLKWPTLIAFGDSDPFTNRKKLVAWSEKLAERSEKRLEWVKIAGAGHFWREGGVRRDLYASIVPWLNRR